MEFSDKLPDPKIEGAPADETLTVELEVLGALGRSVTGAGSSLLDEQLRLLAGYRFRDPTHQIIFDALSEFCRRVAGGSKTGQETLREYVARRLTLRGFPDVDLEAIFRTRSTAENERDLERVILLLKGST